MSVESVMPSNHLIFHHPLLPLPSIFPRIRVFPANQFFTSGSQSIGAPASASVLPMNIQGWFPLRLTGLISLLSKVLSRVFSCTTIWKHKFFSAQPSLWSNSHIHTWLQEKSKQTIALTIWTFVSKMMFLLLNMLSMLDIAFLPRSKRLLFSWLYSLSTVILEPKTRVFPWSSKSSYSSLLALTPKILKDCCCSVTKSCSTLCNPMNSSTPGFGSLKGNTEVPGTDSSVPLLPSWSRKESRSPCVVWKGPRPSQHTSGWSWPH